MAQARLLVKGVDPLGYLIDEFKKNPSVNLAFRLLPWAHGTQAQVDSKGDVVATVLKVHVGES